MKDQIYKIKMKSVVDFYATVHTEWSQFKINITTIQVHKDEKQTVSEWYWETGHKKDSFIVR